jgi:hypothetical protein
MANPTSLPIAQLRALGCKVNTLIGHDPAIGSWQYGITLPDGVGPTEFTDIDQDAQAGVIVRVATDKKRVLYSRVLPRPGMLPPKRIRDAAEKQLAERLESAAGYLRDRLAAR